MGFRLDNQHFEKTMNEGRKNSKMKHTFTLLTALLLASLAAPMNFQGLETVLLESSKHWN